MKNLMREVYGLCLPREEDRRDSIIGNHKISNRLTVSITFFESLWIIVVKEGRQLRPSDKQ